MALDSSDTGRVRSSSSSDGSLWDQPPQGRNTVVPTPTKRQLFGGALGAHLVASSPASPVTWDNNSGSNTNNNSMSSKNNAVTLLLAASLSPHVSLTAPAPPPVYAHPGMVMQPTHSALFRTPPADTAQPLHMPAGGTDGPMMSDTLVRQLLALQQQQRRLEQQLVDADQTGDLLAAMQLSSHSPSQMTCGAGTSLSITGTGPSDDLGSTSSVHTGLGSGTAVQAGDGWSCAVTNTMNLCAEAVVGTQQQPSSSLYVRNLPPEADELWMYQKFAPHGAVLSCKPKMDTATGLCRGVGFINFADPTCAVRAMQQLQGARTSQGRQLHITLQAPRAVRAAAAAAQTAAVVVANATNAGLLAPRPRQVLHAAPQMQQVQHNAHVALNSASLANGATVLVDGNAGQQVLLMHPQLQQTQVMQLQPQQLTQVQQVPALLQHNMCAVRQQQPYIGNTWQGLQGVQASGSFM